MEFARVKWVAKPTFSGAAAPHGCLYTDGVSQPVPRLMVQGRVKALPKMWHLLCPECLEPEDYAKPLAEQPHKATCTRYVAPKAEPALDAAPPDPPPAAQHTDVAPPVVLAAVSPAVNKAAKGRRF